jgi:hypothetical protein
MLGLSIKEEMDEFIVVNNSQKGVPRALTTYLEGTEEAAVAWQLNEDPDSPFYGKITRTSIEKQHLFTLSSVARQVKELFKSGKLVDLDSDNKVDYMERFFNIVADALQNEWADIQKLDDDESRGRRDFEFKLLELTGLIAWCTFGGYILDRSYSIDVAAMNWDNVRRLVKAASGVDWRKNGQYEGRTGLAGARVIAQEMERLLPAETETAEDEAAP